MNAGRKRLLLLAAVFMGPLIAAALLYYVGGPLQPDERTNAGRLLLPIVNLDEALGTTTVAELSGDATAGRWALVYRQRGDCDAACEDMLYRMRQSWRMLGRDMTRVVRVLLRPESGPDTVLPEPGDDRPITIRNDALGYALGQNRPSDLAPGGLFLIDPLGNLVMYFTADLPPEDMVSDIEHLLELSRIG